MTTPDLNDLIAVVPLELRELPNFVVWRLQKRKEGPTKVPYSPTTKRGADSSDPATWGTLNASLKAFLSGPYNGIGFMFGSGFSGTDLDHCRDKKTGKIEPWALAIVEELDSYTEISPSGDGLHIFTKGKLPGKGINRRVDGHKIEMYDSGRFFTLTGEHLPTTPKTINERQGELSELYEWVLKNCDSSKRAQKKKAGAGRQTSQPVNLDDQELLRRAFKAANGAKFQRLHSGDSSGYWKYNGEPDLSDADQAYVNILCFWSQDDQQVARIWRSSGRYREKLDRDDYVFGTIKTARESQTEMYTGGLGLQVATPGESEEEITGLAEIEDDDPPISSNDKRERYLRQLVRNTGKVMEVTAIFLGRLRFVKNHTRLLNALIAIGGDRLNTFGASQARIRERYGESSEACSEDTVRRDIKRLLEEQNSLGVAVITYTPGTQDRLGNNYVSTFRNNLLRWTLQAIDISLDLPDEDSETGKKMKRREKLEIACDKVIESIPRFEPVKPKEKQPRFISSEEIIARREEIDARLIETLLADGWSEEEIERECERLEMRRQSRLKNAVKSRVSEAPIRVASCNPYRAPEIEPDMEVITIQ